MKRALLAAALIMQAAPALAGAFDTYQLLMWQERTPAQIKGMKRLGFTGTKLQATGGQINADQLAAHVASGLPWYLENIATDFYAPYHRYTPGKSVTWLFDAAKARRRADPADQSVFVREPSLSDHDWQARIAARLQRVVREQEQYHPLYYNLADESGIADLAAAWDDDIGPASLAAMRVWLHTQYPSLPALNQEWGTDFARWDDVVPQLTDAALVRTDANYASWADFKAWMDVAFARAVRAGTDAVHAADTQALAGLEGAQLPGWGGYDYSLLAPTVDVMEIYDTANSVALARAFNPGLIILRTSFGAGDGAEAWRQLLEGGRGTIVWDEGDAVVHPDGSPAPRGAELGALVTAIRAVAPEIMASAPSLDPVAVLISQASFRTQWLLDRIPGGSAWSDRSAGREYEDNAWRASRREMLARLSGLGVQPHLLASATPESLKGVKVLILPDTIALSDTEVAAIRAFAKDGGTVLADTEPGLFDGHSRHRAQAPLQGLAQVPEPLLRSGNVPDPGALDAVAGLLAGGGVTPRATLRGPNGARATGIEARWFKDGAAELLSIQAVAPYAAPGEIDIDLERNSGVSDLRRGGGPTNAQHLHVHLDVAEPTILKLTQPN